MIGRQSIAIAAFAVCLCLFAAGSLANAAQNDTAHLLRQARRLAFEENDCPRALQMLRYLSADNPHDAEPLLLEAQVLMLTNEDSQAGKILARAIKIKDSGSAHALLGELALNAGEQKGAIAEFEKALALDPREPLALGRLGDLYSAQGDSQRGDLFFARLLEVKPDDVHARLNLAFHLDSECNHDRLALTMIKKGLHINSSNALLNCYAGILAARLGGKGPDDPREYLRAALRNDPHDVIPFEQLAIIYGASNDWGSSLEYARDCLDLAGSLANVRLLFAWASLHTGDFLEAKRIIQMLVDTFPDDPGVNNLNGIVLCELKQYEQAASAFERALKLSHGDNLPADLNLAQQYLALKNCRRAADSAETLSDRFGSQANAVALAAYIDACCGNRIQAGALAGKRLAAGEPFALLARARLMQDDKDDKSAIALLQQALTMRPRNSFIMCELARAYLKDLQFAQAVETAQQCLQIAPSNYTAKQLLGESLAGNKNYDGAALLLTECAGREPKSVELRLKLADVLIAKGDFDQAKRQLDTAVRLAPSDPRPLVAIAAMCMKQGLKREALRLARQVQASFPGDAQSARLINELTGGATPKARTSERR